MVDAKSFMLGNGGTEQQPTVAHSCNLGAALYADPAVRLAEVVDAFVPNGSFTSICDDFTSTMTGIAQQMVGE